MCIIFSIANSSPQPGGYKLIVASNRDEFYSRPASIAAAWNDNPFVFGGRDLEAGREGGTWLALSAKGGIIKVGALLNITGEKKKKDASGRGFLVSNYVTGNISNEEYCRNLIDTSETFNGYNLVTIELKDKQATTLHCSNSPFGMQEWPEEKVVAFGNTPPEAQLKKVQHGKLKFQEILENHVHDSKEDLVENLMNMLQSREKCFPDEELSRRAPRWGEHLSSICVKMPEAGYGTRTHTVMLVDWQNRIDFYETTMITSEPDDQWKRTHIFRQL